MKTAILAVCFLTVATAATAMPLPGVRTPTGNIVCFYVPQRPTTHGNLLCSVKVADYARVAQAKCMARSGLDWHDVESYFRPNAIGSYSFDEQNNVVFYKVAEEIIAEELAANHHALANDLKKSLGRGQEAMKKTAHTSGLTLLPKDRRNGESLVTLKESTVDLTKIVLGREARPKIERVIDEHHRRPIRHEPHGEIHLEVISSTPRSPA